MPDEQQLVEMAKRGDEQLVREIGVAGLTANIVNATVGAGMLR